MSETKVQILLQKVMPQLALYLRSEVAPLISEDAPIEINSFDMFKLKKMLG